MFLGTNLEVILRLNLSTIISILAVHGVSRLWYSKTTFRSRESEGFRYLMASITCDIAMVIALQYILDNTWEVTEWKGAFHIAIWLSILYISLQAPHHVYNSESFITSLSAASHKFVILFVASICLIYFKNVSL